MAPLTLVSTKPLFLKPSSLPLNPNRRFSLLLHQSPTSSFSVRCTNNSYGEFEQEQTMVCPKPEEIEWSKDLVNSVRLIGNVGQPVQIKQLNSGKVVAWTKLGIWKSSTETTWVNLTFWEELAHMVHQHVETGQKIFVSGRLVSDIVKGEDETVQVFFKVVVQELKLVGRRNSPVSTYDPNQISANSPGSVEELWQAFFASPLDWWDNRTNKRNPNYPDFKHKDTGEALWLNGKYNPSWVKSQIEILDSKMATMQNNNNSRNSSPLSFSDLTSF